MNEEKLVLNGYTLEDNFSHVGGEVQWTFAEKDGKRWFIKRFQDPVFPIGDTSADEEFLQWKRRECVRFYKEKRKLYDAVNSCANGNIVTIADFFQVNGRYHVVTERIDYENITMEDVAKIADKDKFFLMLTLTNSMMRLHEQGLVYADLRPDNVLFKRSATGKIISKLIDFDGSYFEGEENPEKIPVSPQYIAPETGQIDFFGEEAKLTRKVDVFSLALMYHLYWTGKLPKFDTSEYDFAFIQVLDGRELELSEDLPPELAELMQRMLKRDPGERPEMSEIFEELKKIITPPEPDLIDIGHYFFIPRDFVEPMFL